LKADHWRRALADRQKPFRAVLGARKRLNVGNRIIAAKRSESSGFTGSTPKGFGKNWPKST
jgi:hypothetical protein